MIAAPRLSTVPAYAPQPRAAASENRNPAFFVVGALITFFLFSRASEFLDSHGRFHLVTILVLMGSVALFAAGTIPEMVATRPGIWLAAFTAWLTFSLPFSSWRGGSFANFSGVWLKSVVFFLLIGGLIFSVQQFRKTMFWLALATASVMYAAVHAGANAVDERFSVTYGTLGNSNDLAGSLLMGLPFVVYVATDKRRNIVVRIGCFLLTFVLLGLIARTGSRGGLLATGCLVVLAFFKASAGGKAKILVIVLAAAACLPFVVSKALVARYATILTSDNKANASMDVMSANESTGARKALMKQGVLLTLHHPVFGVGLSQFSNQSANLFIARGEQPMWFTCHDIYLLVSSETGLPGFFCYMAIVVVCFKDLFRLQRVKQTTQDRKDLADMAFCVLMSLTAFLICGIFSTSAYTFQLPLLASLTAALSRVAKPLLATGGEPAPPVERDDQSWSSPRYRTRPAAPAIA